MKTHRLGTQGLEVGAIGLGCMGMSVFYGPRDEAESARHLDGRRRFECVLAGDDELHHVPRTEFEIVAGIADRATQIDCAVSRIAIPLTPTTTGGGVLGQELLGDRGIGILGSGGHGQRLIGDDPSLGFGHHMRPTPIPVCLR